MMARWALPSPSKNIAPRPQSATVAGACGITVVCIAGMAGAGVRLADADGGERLQALNAITHVTRSMTNSRCMVIGPVLASAIRRPFADREEYQAEAPI